MNRRFKVRQALTAFLLSTLAITALAAPRVYSVPANSPALAEFAFTVTLIPVPGTVKAVSAKLNFDPKDLSTANGTVNVNVGKLETGIGLRDEHARNYIGADKHPNAIFTLTRILGIKSLEAGKETKANVVGTFDLNGIRKPLIAPITLTLQTNNQIAVSTTFDVTLSDHKISIPGGDPTVVVKVKFNLSASNTKP